MLTEHGWEAYVLLRTLLETERWTTDELYPDLEDDLAAPLSSDHKPDQWTFFSTGKTAFKGKWVLRKAGYTKPTPNEVDEECVVEAPEREPYKEAYLQCKDRSEHFAKVLLEDTRPDRIPAPSTVRAPLAWRKNKGGWVLNIRDLDIDGKRGVEFAASTRDLNDQLVERVLIRGEVTTKGINVSLFLEDPRRARGQRDSSIVEGDMGLLHFMTLFFGEERWSKPTMGPPPLPVRAWYVAR